MNIKTQRLIVTKFTLDMAESVHVLSLDEDNNRFVPDEVFNTIEEAQEILDAIIFWYGQKDKPQIYAITFNGQHIGHVQAVPFDDDNWEIGYHVGKEYTNKGFATEAVKAFLAKIMQQLKINKILGICHASNIASLRVLKKCGFRLEYAGKGEYQNKIQDICRFVYNG